MDMLRIGPVGVQASDERLVFRAAGVKYSTPTFLHRAWTFSSKESTTVDACVSRGFAAPEALGVLATPRGLASGKLMIVERSLPLLSQMIASQRQNMRRVFVSGRSAHSSCIREDADDDLHAAECQLSSATRSRDAWMLDFATRCSSKAASVSFTFGLRCRIGRPFLLLE